MNIKTVAYSLIIFSVCLSACGRGNSDSSSPMRNFVQRNACSEQDKNTIVDLMAETTSYPDRFVRAVQSNSSSSRELLTCVSSLRDKTLNRALGTGARDAAWNRAYNQLLMEHGMGTQGAGPFDGSAQSFHCAQEFSKLSSAITRVANGEGTSALRSVYSEQYQAIELGSLLTQMSDLDFPNFFAPDVQYAFRKDASRICLMF